jgi:hypothetical protein
MFIFVGPKKANGRETRNKKKSENYDGKRRKDNGGVGRDTSRTVLA